jgi:RNA methyltransferase, TrmH family
VKRLSSRDNPGLKAIAELAGSARERRRRAASYIEGVNLCEAFLDRHGQPLTVLVTDEALRRDEVRALVPAGHPDVLLVSDALFKEVSQVQHGVGLAYVVPTPAPVLPSRVTDDSVYLDRLQDPGNVGTLLRTCAAAGVRRVITAPHTAFCWSPKVLRAGMGAHFVLDIHEGVAWSDLAPRLDLPVMATSGSGVASLYDCDLRAPRIWVFGNEGGGLVSDLAGGAANWVSIPQDPAVESLNVSVAAAVCLFEQRRQRRLP